jgi:hypothetical protein
MDFTYSYYTDDDIINFFKNNYNEEFKNITEKYISLIDDNDKNDLFKYYYLYLKGGIYIDYFSIINKNISSIIQNYSFVAVKSYKNLQMSPTIIGCELNNPIIYLSLKHLYSCDINNINSTCAHMFLYNNIENIEIDNKKIYIEKKNEGTYDNSIESVILHEFDENLISFGEELMLTKYYKYSIIKSSNELPIKTNEYTEKTKIGITFDMPENFESLFCNGIRQNILFFNELLLNIGYDVYFIVQDSKLKNQNNVQKIFYDKRFKAIKDNDIFIQDFDIVFCMGYELTTYVLTTLKYLKTIIILYHCGNSYIIDSENTIYKQNILPNPEYSRLCGLDIYSEIWSIPQMINTNQYYWQTLYRCKCLEVPFIWSHTLLDINEKNLKISSNLETMYIKKNNNNPKKTLAIFEPNISIMKWGLPALLVCENAYRLNKNLIGDVYFNNTTNGNVSLLNKDNLNKLVSCLDLFKDGKISVEGRYNISFFMAKYADFAISHQWENNLNYLYLDLAWMGYPIIHNASLCQDIGYYYEGFNYEMGGNKLLEALNDHDKNAQAYLEINRKKIDRYLPSNKQLQFAYKQLIDNVFKKLNF